MREHSLERNYLIHYASSTNVEVANFTVAHETVRQSDVYAMRADLRAVATAQTIHHRRIRVENRVA